MPDARRVAPIRGSVCGSVQRLRLEVAFSACVLCLRPFHVIVSPDANNCFYTPACTYLHVCPLIIHASTRLHDWLYHIRFSALGERFFDQSNRNVYLPLSYNRPSVPVFSPFTIEKHTFPQHKPRPRPLTRLFSPKNEKNVLSDSLLVPKSPFD